MAKKRRERGIELLPKMIEEEVIRRLSVIRSLHYDFAYRGDGTGKNLIE